MVNQYEAREHSLYSKAREAEGVRRKQVQVVEKLQEDLEHLKQRNAVKLKVSPCDTAFIITLTLLFISGNTDR